MKISKQKIYLVVAGILLSVIGAYISFVPLAYLGQFAIVQSPPVEFLSELRGMGGSLLVLGLFVLFGGFNDKFQSTAMLVSVLIFTAFSIFRVIGVFSDGMPSEGIVIALIIEIGFALLALALIRDDTDYSSLSVTNSLN